MKRSALVVTSLALILSVFDWTLAPAEADEPALLELSGDLGVHDPVMIKEGDTYYVFYTGGARGGRGRGRGRRGGRGSGENPAAEASAEPVGGQTGVTQSSEKQPAAQQAAGQSVGEQPATGQPTPPAPTGSINMLTSQDMKTWTRAGFALERLPDWTRDVPDRRNPNDAWAPDIAYYQGKYHLYYSISSFGSQNSAIGLATNKTLDPKSPDYKWEDAGIVVDSRRGRDDFNAIDPNLVIEDENNAWLSWGSFQDGIMMRRVDPKTGRLSETDTTLYKLARREQGTAIEAPTIIRHGDDWYLFVSWDRCCPSARRPISDYKIVVGRSDKVTGPYLDKEGKKLSEGGGSIILDAATDNWLGAGHNGYFREQGVDYMPFHAYPNTEGRSGRSRLQITTVVWENGWPRVAKMP
jgi:arabinan endo-1,5-alpha-L-arabinosidase